ncbi:MAG TPA: type II secretion system F family protein [Burkholderiaceae bacterium]|nr:type II secretion system F family protein [Burkholderiaceae bacterium]
MNFLEIRARLAFGPKARAEFYGLLESFVNDAVPLYDAVQDIHAHYERNRNPRLLITQRIVAGARGATGAVQRLSSSLAWCASPAEVLALDAGEQAGAVALGLRTARAVALRNSQVMKSIAGRLLYPVLFLMALIGLLIFARVETMPIYNQLLPRARWPLIPQILGKITDLVPVGVPAFVGGLVAYLVAFQVTAATWKPGPVRRFFDRFMFPYTVYAQANLAITLSGLSALVGAKVSFGMSIERMRDKAKPWLYAQLDGVMLRLRQGEREGEALATLYRGEESWLISAYGKRSNFAEALAGLSDRINDKLTARIAAQFGLVSALLLVLGAFVLAIISLSFGQMGLAIKNSY